MQNTAHEVITKCGGVSRVADILKISYSRVYHWSWQAGVVPAKHQYRLLCAARKAGIDLTPDDFFPAKIPPVKTVGRKTKK